MEYDEDQGKTYGAKLGTFRKPKQLKGYCVEKHSRPTPKLPEGYRVEVTKLGLELWHLNSSHCLVVFNDGVFCFNPVYPKDAPAVIAFLKGAR